MRRLGSWGLVVVLTAMLAVGCGSKTPPATQAVVTVTEYVDRAVPTPVKPEVPPELLEKFTGPLPEFVHPSHPDATSALTAEGERRLLALILFFVTRDAAWLAFVTGP